jgi:hypothetical protein
VLLSEVPYIIWTKLGGLYNGCHGLVELIAGCRLLHHLHSWIMSADFANCRDEDKFVHQCSTCVDRFNAFLSIMRPLLWPLWNALQRVLPAVETIADWTRWFSSASTIRALLLVISMIPSSSTELNMAQMVRLGREIDSFASATTSSNDFPGTIQEGNLRGLKQYLKQDCALRLSASTINMFHLMEALNLKTPRLACQVFTSLDVKSPDCHICVTAAANTIRCCCVTYPEVSMHSVCFLFHHLCFKLQGSVLLLSSLVVLWAKTNVSSDVGNLSLVYTAIYSLACAGVLNVLYCADPKLFVRVVYVPLLSGEFIEDSSAEAGALVLASVTSLLNQPQQDTFLSSLCTYLVSELIAARSKSSLGSLNRDDLYMAISSIIGEQQFSLLSLEDYPDVLYHLLVSDLVQW